MVETREHYLAHFSVLHLPAGLGVDNFEENKMIDVVQHAGRVEPVNGHSVDADDRKASSQSRRRHSSGMTRIKDTRWDRTASVLGLYLPHRFEVPPRGQFSLAVDRSDGG